MPYLVNEGGNPSSDCCNGVRKLQSLTPSTGERRAACQCMKQEAGKVHNIKPGSASNLPGKCGVQVPVPIRGDVDCNS
ncbi:hypothetical protein CDL15_Pgr000459 [Punica granatum]|nr:hypothetical protein CDL15_Pgr000459 [Punica granatum]